MTTVDALLIGMLSAFIVVGAIIAGRKIWDALKVIPKLKATMDRQVAETVILADAAKLIAMELQYMRTLATAQASQGQNAEVNVPGFGVNLPPTPIPSFPSPVFDRFPSKPVPDAELGDTDDVSLTQTDEDMAQLEQIEKLRQQGIQVDEPDVEHPGLTVESE